MKKGINILKLKARSVIYMKKMMNRKRGFTLTEIVVVIAVIVLLSSVSIVGIAATIQKANSAQEGVQKHNEFELVAWQEVKDIGKGLGGSYEPPTYNPNNEEAISQEWQDQIDEWIEEGYDPSDIIVEKDDNGNITNARIKDGATPKTNNSGSSGGASTGAGSNGGSTDGTNSGNNSGGGTSGQQNQNQQNQQNQNGSANNGNSSSSGIVTAPIGKGGNGKPEVTKISGSGDSQSLEMTSLDGWNAGQVGITITRDNSGNYTGVIDKGAYVFVQGGMPGANYNGTSFPIDQSGKDWLKNNYGIELT